MFVVDTNVLVYAANAGSDAHAACKSALERWRAQTGGWYLTWGICFEFLRVVTHRRILPAPLRATEAWQFLSALLHSPGLEMLAPSERYADVLRDIMHEMPALAGNQMHDLQTAALMRDRGIKTIYTRDTDFHRFRFLEVIDPTVAAGGRGGLHES